MRDEVDIAGEALDRGGASMISMCLEESNRGRRPSV